MRGAHSSATHGRTSSRSASVKRRPAAGSPPPASRRSAVAATASRHRQNSKIAKGSPVVRVSARQNRVTARYAYAPCTTRAAGRLDRDDAGLHVGQQQRGGPVPGDEQVPRRGQALLPVLHFKIIKGYGRSEAQQPPAFVAVVQAYPKSDLVVFGGEHPHVGARGRRWPGAPAAQPGRRPGSE